MNTIRITAVALTALTCTLTMNAQPKLTATNIDEVIAAMTLEEKAQLLVGGGNDSFVGSGAMLGHQEKLVAGAAGTTVGIARLGIPETCVADGPAGIHIDTKRKNDPNDYSATGFPVGTCLASTWNTELVRQVGEAMGNETLEFGVDVILGPGMNLHRNPLSGRNFEYYSEDPFVTGAIGAAMVKGIQSQGVGVSAKHFAVNSQESDRTRVDERLSQRALRELYLRGFEKMVRESKPWTVMSSYNIINGVYAQGSKDLLTTILRDEWGFKGMVMTDWLTTSDFSALLSVGAEKKYDKADAALCVLAQNDLVEPGEMTDYERVLEGLKEGVITRAHLERNAKNILTLLLRSHVYCGKSYYESVQGECITFC